MDDRAFYLVIRHREATRAAEGRRADEWRRLHAQSDAVPLDAPPAPRPARLATVRAVTRRLVGVGRTAGL